MTLNHWVRGSSPRGRTIFFAFFPDIRPDSELESGLSVHCQRGDAVNILEAVFMGVGLAMDALAVSLTLGAIGWSCPKTRSSSDHSSPVCSLCHPRGRSCSCSNTEVSGRGLLTWDRIVLIAASFGVFQAMMPTIGWFGSGLFGGLAQKLGRIAAGVLLAFVGAQMLREGFSKEEDPAKKIGVCSLRRLVVLSFATSVDALLVGVSYACLGRANIAGDVLVIGAVTAAISAAGCVCGRMFGNRFGNRSTVLGGLVLLGIAVKIMFFG